MSKMNNRTYQDNHVTYKLKSKIQDYHCRCKLFTSFLILAVLGEYFIVKTIKKTIAQLSIAVLEMNSLPTIKDNDRNNQFYFT